MFGDILFALRTVLRSPERLRALLAGGPSTAIELSRFMMRIVPISEVIPQQTFALKMNANIVVASCRGAA